MEIFPRPEQELSEKVAYNQLCFPAYARRDFLSQYPNYSGLPHWHDDLEFICVKSGSMQYNVNGSVLALGPKEGVFVNTRQIHYGYSAAHTECDFVCVLLHPSLLCASGFVEEQFVAPVLSNAAFPFWKLRGEIPWERSVLQEVFQIYQAFSLPAFPLRVQSLFCGIWEKLYTHVPHAPAGPSRQDAGLASLKDMIRYIQKHYPEKLSLEQIASAGNVCQSRCCALFRSCLNQTPIGYLTEYRLKKSVERMLSSSRSLSEISYETGFSGPSYFSETFRKYLGTSPTEYRKAHSKTSHSGFPARTS